MRSRWVGVLPLPASARGMFDPDLLVALEPDHLFSQVIGVGEVGSPGRRRDSQQRSGALAGCPASGGFRALDRTADLAQPADNGLVP